MELTAFTGLLTSRWRHARWRCLAKLWRDSHGESDAGVQGLGPDVTRAIDSDSQRST